MDPSLRVIAEEWRDEADALARFTLAKLVNRVDIWGQYLPIARRRMHHGRLQMFVTAPFGRARGKVMLDHATLVKHYVALDQGSLISLHATSTERTSRWLAIDLDVHDPEAEEAPVQRAANRNAALVWLDELAARGFDPLLFDTNGAGGLHLWAIFGEPVETAFAQELVLDLVSDWARVGLPRRPEIWPKGGEASEPERAEEEGSTGGCLRLPGRHHTREHWTRVYSPEPELDEPWLSGKSAIRRILDVRLPSLSEIRKTTPRSNLTSPSPDLKPTKRKGGRPSVCVDLDGVLAQYDGWKGIKFLGDPIPGAVEMTHALSQFADVIVFTTRCSVDANLEELRLERELPWDAPPETLRAMLPAYLAQKVRYWLEKHGFAFASVWTGQGKPIASAYIDDRAVSCRPQEDPQAFETALTEARRLVERRKK